MAYDLAGKVVLITGAAGGIGTAAARALLAAGCRLVVTDRLEADMAALADTLPAEACLPLALDVTDTDAARAAVARAVVRFGRLDIAFANAGIAWSGPPRTLSMADDAEFTRIVEVDLLGVWRTMSAVLPEVRRNGGQVVACASAYAFVNGMCNAPYAASKAAVEMLSRALRAELAGTGASASTLYPGWVTTPIARLALGGDDLVTRMLEASLPAALRAPVPPEQVAAALVAGLKQRRARIFVPRRWGAVWLLRGVLTALADRKLDRAEDMHAMVRELEERESEAPPPPGTRRD